MTLSGRVDSLEGQVLSLPTNRDISISTQLTAGRLNTLEIELEEHDEDIVELQEAFANLEQGGGGVVPPSAPDDDSSISDIVYSEYNIMLGDSSTADVRLAVTDATGDTVTIE